MVKTNAYFWNHEYRHILRYATRTQQNKVLRKFVYFGLEIDGASSKHLEIINDIIK